MSDDRSYAGRLFDVVGLCIVKLRWPIDIRAHGTIRMPDAAVQSVDAEDPLQRPPEHLPLQ